MVWSRTRGVSDMCPHLINGVTAGCRDRGKFCLLFVLSGFSKCSPTKRKLWSCGGRRWGGAEECQGGLGVTSYGVIGTGMPSDGPIHRWAVSVGEQVCLQGPGGGLAPWWESQAALKEGLGVLGCPYHQEASGQGSGLLCRGLCLENQVVRGLWGAH